MHSKRSIGEASAPAGTLDVNPIGYGAWQLSNENRPGEAAATEVIRAAADSGAQLLDTADAYCLTDDDFGHNEELVAAILRKLGLGSSLHVATKVGCRRPGGAWTEDGRPEWIRECCEASLRRLGVETIELYQLHWPDAKVPIEESVGAMAALQRAGKVQRIGLCNVDAGLLARAQTEAVIVSVQNKCNPWAQEDVRNGFIDQCGEQGIAYLPWYPVGGSAGHRACASDPKLKAIAKRYDVSPYQVLLAWLLGLGDHVLPIPGASRVASITDSLGAMRLKLSAEDQAAVGSLA